MGKAPQALQNARTRMWQEEVQMLLSLLDCVVLDKEAVYASSEFTTGRRLYELCRQYNMTTKEELKKRLGKEYERQLLLPNREEGIRFARRLREFGHVVVLTPNPFQADPLRLEGQNWSQDEYLEFWKMIIQTKCQAVYFNEGWEFSDGCTFEYCVGSDMGLSLFDHLGNPLPREKAADLIWKAVQILEADGFTVAKLRENWGRLA